MYMAIKGLVLYRQILKQDILTSEYMNKFTHYADVLYESNAVEVFRNSN